MTYDPPQDGATNLNELAIPFVVELKVALDVNNYTYFNSLTNVTMTKDIIISYIYLPNIYYTSSYLHHRALKKKDIFNVK